MGYPDSAVSNTYDIIFENICESTVLSFDTTVPQYMTFVYGTADPTTHENVVLDTIGTA